MAPILSNIFLGTVDRSLKEKLEGLVVRVFWYVDDFLVVVDRSPCRICPNVLKVFKQCGQGLRFTFELSRDRVLQFLDLRLTFREGHVC